MKQAMRAYAEIRERQIKNAPFCWQHKGSRQMIRDYLQDERGHSADALSVYDALTELASDNQSEIFSVPISRIAERAGVSYKTASKALNRFESLKLIHIKRNIVQGTKELAPSTYTMLGTPDPTLGKQIQKCLPRRRKNQKNRKT